MKWSGIFAHRQNKGLIESGADLKVVQPVSWYPPAPFTGFHAHWKELSKIPYPKEREYDGVKVYHPRIANMKPSRLFNKKYAEKYIDSITGFFSDQGIKLDPSTDIFYSQWIPVAGMVQQAAHKLGVKSAILTIGDDVLIWPHERPENIASFNKTWEEADFRIGVAAYLAEEANKLAGKKLPYYVVRRGVEHDKFVPARKADKPRIKAELKLPADKLILLSVGSAIVRKGWLELFDALAKLKPLYPNIMLVGIHSGAHDIDLDAEAAKRGVSDIFMNLGEVDPKRINQMYTAADIFCLPSHWEGIANAVVEAMSCGLPVLTSNVCGHPELITSGKNGVLVPPKQPEMVFTELKKLIADENYRDTLGANARNFIVNEWGSFAQNSAKLYKILTSK